MTAYFFCLCGRRKQQARDLQNQGFDIVVTKDNPMATEKAKSYGKRLPIKVVDGIAVRI